MLRYGNTAKSEYGYSKIHVCSNFVGTQNLLVFQFVYAQNLSDFKVLGTQNFLGTQKCVVSKICGYSILGVLKCGYSISVYSNLWVLKH